MDLSRCPWPPKPHQVHAIEQMLNRVAYANFDEVGAGKTLPPVAVSCALYSLGLLNAMVVVAPTPARSVWADPDPVLGEYAKHAWPGVPYAITEYCRRTPKLPAHAVRSLQIVVTNYEFIRRDERLEPLLAWIKQVGPALAVFDESWMVQNHTAQQYKACQKISKLCGRTTVLNGTPGDTKNMFNQFYLMDPSILGYKNFWAFRGRHAQMGGYMNKQIVGWHNLEAMQAAMAPYMQRNLTRSVFNLGDEPGRSIVEVPLTPATWALYKSMRDDLVAWLNSTEASIAKQAGVRVMRMAQLTSGFLGGVEAPTDSLWTPPINDVAREVGREKLDALLAWLDSGWPTDPPRKLLVFTRFRRDVERTAAELARKYADIPVYRIYGAQDEGEREAAKRALAPGGTSGAAIVVANTQSGGAGLNFAGADLCIFLSNDYSLKTRLQAEGRVDRPGQTRWVRYVDFLATGPNGQKTTDHGVLKKLRNKEELANQSLPDVWREVLSD